MAGTHLSIVIATHGASSRAFTPVHSPRRRALTPFRPGYDARERVATRGQSPRVLELTN